MKSDKDEVIAKLKNLNCQNCGHFKKNLKKREDDQPTLLPMSLKYYCEIFLTESTGWCHLWEKTKFSKE